MQNEQYNPNLPNHSIPFTGVSTGMIFKSRVEGFVTLQTGALPKIFITKDGGQSWNPGQPFLVNEQLESCDRVITGKPEFFDVSKTNGWMSVGCQNDKDKTITYHGYFTANGGDNWKFTPFELKSPTGGNHQSAPTFLNSQVGWAIIGDTLYHTANQGKLGSLLRRAVFCSLSLRNILRRLRCSLFPQRWDGFYLRKRTKTLAPLTNYKWWD